MPKFLHRNSKKYEPGNIITKGVIAKVWDRWAPIFFVEKEYVEMVPTSVPGTTHYKILNELPSLEDYRAMADSFFTMALPELLDGAVQEIEAAHQNLDSYAKKVRQSKFAGKTEYALQKIAAIDELDIIMKYIAEEWHDVVPYDLGVPYYYNLDKKNAIDHINEAIAVLNKIEEVIEEATDAEAHESLNHVRTALLSIDLPGIE